MLRYHMAVVTRDNALKREVKRVTTATGSTADFIGDASGLNPKRKVHLAIFDARRDLPDKKFFQQVPRDAAIQYVLRGDSLVERLPLFKEDRVTSLLCHDARFDDDEFIASATKALRGDVFGLQKYFPWGVTTFSMQVQNYEEKSRAIDILLRYAKLAGVRGPVRDRIQLVCDELMMNALYHAPVDADGKELYAGKSLKEMAQKDKVQPIQVQYGCSGRYFGVSVRDAGGSLSRLRALDYLIRAKSGSMIETKAGGAGLGLISVLKSVSKLVFNLDPGYSTEVIGLFDMELFAKGKVGARSLHIFSAAPPPEEEEEEEEEEAPQPSGGGGAAKWVLVAVLLAVMTAMGTIYAMRKQESPPELTVVAHPGQATITLDKKAIKNGSAVALPTDKKKLILRVEREGFQPFSEELSPEQVKNNLRIHVNLRPLK